MLEIRNIEKSFGATKAVNNVSLTIKPGEILGLLGTNGAGKTTTFRMILGIFKPDNGSILLDGKKIKVGESKEIGFLPEERSLLPKYTIEEQLLFFGELKGKKVKELNPLIDQWLAYFDLTDHKQSKIKELSKGNQQKIQFITAVIHQPKLIILDEPFSGLDPLNIKLIKEAIAKLRTEGAMIIFSSHRLDYVESFAKDVIVLDHGNLILSGNIDAIKQESNEYVIEIECYDDLTNLSTLDYVQGIEHYQEGKYKFTIREYANVDNLFSVVKDFKIRGFNVQLPSLEDILIKSVGGSHE